jgi:ABC-type sugar transport system ATPase subunit
MTDSILTFANIEKSFFGVRVLKNISLGIPRGAVLGLVGENGAGKSTLMNVVGGVVAPDAGEMLLDGRPYAPRSPGAANAAGVAFIHQELNLFTNLSIAENIFINGFPHVKGLPLLHRGAMRARTKQYLDAVDLQVSPDTLVEKLSPGERQLAEIAKALSFNARLIIFDEPTTSLTARETDRLFTLIERLRADGASIVYISHILGDVMRLADRIAVLRDGELVGEGPKAEFTVGRMISLMVGRDIQQLYPLRTATPTTVPALEVRGVSQRGIVEQIDFTLYKGEMLGVFGLMGSGRTELARILFGMDSCERGEILVNGTPHPRRSPRDSIDQGLAFVTENRREEGLLMDISISNNIGLAALPHYAAASVTPLREGKLNAQIAGVVDSLKIKAADVRQQAVKTLSGGNQQKAVIGKWLLNRPEVLIVDEPTRGVDVGAKFEIYTILAQLAADGAGVLFISSELDELLGVCDRILVMSNGEVQAIFARDEFDKERILRAAFREHKPQ